jgi:hypothetical protein
MKKNEDLLLSLSQKIDQGLIALYNGELNANEFVEVELFIREFIREAAGTECQSRVEQYEYLLSDLLAHNSSRLNSFLRERSAQSSYTAIAETIQVPDHVVYRDILRWAGKESKYAALEEWVWRLKNLNTGEVLLGNSEPEPYSEVNKKLIDIEQEFISEIFQAIVFEGDIDKHDKTPLMEALQGKKPSKEIFFKNKSTRLSIIFHELKRRFDDKVVKSNRCQIAKWLTECFVTLSKNIPKKNTYTTWYEGVRQRMDRCMPLSYSLERLINNIAQKMKI